MTKNRPENKDVRKRERRELRQQGCSPPLCVHDKERARTVLIILLLTEIGETFISHAILFLFGSMLPSNTACRNLGDRIYIV